MTFKNPKNKFWQSSKPKPWDIFLKAVHWIQQRNPSFVFTDFKVNQIILTEKEQVNEQTKLILIGCKIRRNSEFVFRFREQLIYLHRKTWTRFFIHFLPQVLIYIVQKTFFVPTMYFELFFAHKSNTTAVWAVKDSTFRWWEARSAKAHNETKLILKSHMNFHEYLHWPIQEWKSWIYSKYPIKCITFMRRIWFDKNSRRILLPSTHK